MQWTFHTFNLFINILFLDCLIGQIGLNPEAPYQPLAEYHLQKLYSIFFFTFQLEGPALPILTC